MGCLRFLDPTGPPGGEGDMMMGVGGWDDNTGSGDPGEPGMGDPTGSACGCLRRHLKILRQESQSNRHLEDMMAGIGGWDDPPPEGMDPDGTGMDNTGEPGMPGMGGPGGGMCGCRLRNLKAKGLKHW